MTIKHYFFSILFFITIKFIFAQDTITVLQYNLLNYGIPVYGCDNSNNSPENKDSYLRTITSYVRPDVFTVNEMRVESYDTTAVDRILENVLNIHFNPAYKRANITNLAGSHIINMLYYNTEKFTLYSQDVIPAYRDINVYKLFYKSDDLQENNDTLFLTCIVTHLKSSQGADNEAIRAEMTSSIMNYIEENNLFDNVLLMGDFNIYTDQEEAFQNLINPANEEITFYDPIEQIGNWHNNDAFAAYHTQSTHTTYNNCASSGGMDDRFDYILMNKSVKNNLFNLVYKTDSYKAIGNDGSCFNESLLSCENVDLSSELKTALYNMSDHLPITLKLTTDKSPALFSRIMPRTGLNVEIKNLNFHEFELQLVNAAQGLNTIQIYSSLGKLIYVQKTDKSRVTISLNNETGIYFMKVVDARQRINIEKLVIIKE
ncbi:MAG: T9SS type A sorting domain-containing protein [Chlorobi bacterium]|nr:T9SS type A sorting domain-containing protein [Chlorobiota bacterium]